MKKNKLLLIGWDAADWKIIWPLISKGQMPALQKVIANGVYGNMSTMNPPYSPMLWSSVATGKTPDKHGVLGFIEVLPNLDGVRPVTANSRKARALWNILHHEGYKSNIVGWWPSFPAEPINGVVVSDKFQKVSPDPSKRPPMAEGTIHPWELKDELKDLRMFPYEVTGEHILPMIPRASEIDQEKEKGLYSFSKILAQNVSVHNAATRLMRTTEWDFMAVYFDLIDHFCHAFMKYHPPRLKGVPERQYEIYKDAVNSAYRFQDMLLERKLQLIDEDTTVIIVSDHGYESGIKRLIKMPKLQAAPAFEHRQFGIFVASGPGIKKNQKIYGLGLMDIAPTVLNHFGLPVGEDMDGKAILEMYDEPVKPKFIDSWENVKGDFGELDKDIKQEAMDTQETMEQLIELGYIERPDDKIENAVHKTSLDLQHNLAKVFMGKKEYQKAEEILSAIIEDVRSLDPAPYFFDLVRIKIQQQEYDQAKTFIEKIKSSNTTVRYNLYFYETEILSATGRPKEALKILMDELPKQVNPNPEIHYRIGVLHFQLGEYSLAKNAFESAIELESDTAKYHLKLAETHMELEEYEDAVDESLTAIELVKFFSKAHYTLGRALEKLGDLENAQIAFKTAEALKPRDLQVAQKTKKALENVEEKLAEAVATKDKSTNTYREGQITIVSGLPRSGTSLMMQMLDKGGVEILTDEKRKADDSNPKGYYEYEPVMSLHKNNDWLDKAKNKGLKVVAPLLKNLNPEFRYKVIFMRRDLAEILRSQQIMIGKDPDTFSIKFYNAYQRQLNTIEKWKQREPNIELIYLNYTDVLDNPKESAEKIESFLGVSLDQIAMAKCVDKSLYRNRKEEIKA